MNIRLHLWLIALLLVVSGGLWAQVYNSGGPVVNNAGQAIAAQLAICTTKPAGTNAPDCGVYAPTYTDATLGTPCTLSAPTIGPISGVGCTNPGKTDSRGNYLIFAAFNTVRYIEIYGYGIVTAVSPFTIPGIGTGTINFNQLAGNIAVTQMNSGTGASSTTAWFGDGTWKSVSASAPVSSVFGRTGAVVAVANDYSFSQLSGNIAIAQIAGGTGASGSTVLFGNNTWASPGAGTGNVLSIQGPLGNITISSSPQAIYTYTLPANTLSSTGGIKVNCNLSVQLTGGHTSACMYIGQFGTGTNVGGCSTATSSSPANALWVFDGSLEFWNNGSLSANFNSGSVSYLSFQSPDIIWYNNKLAATDTQNTAAPVNFFCQVVASNGDIVSPGRMFVERLGP